MGQDVKPDTNPSDGSAKDSRNAGTGPRCKCCGTRAMKRIGRCAYACTRTYKVFELKELLWPQN